MQIVIDIPKEDWEFLKASEGCRWSWTILEGAMNGTPLPQGHGRLIDADLVNDHIMGYVDLRDVPTVIPADKSVRITPPIRFCSEHMQEYFGMVCPKCSVKRGDTE